MSLSDWMEVVRLFGMACIGFVFGWTRGYAKGRDDSER